VILIFITSILRPLELLSAIRAEVGFVEAKFLMALWTFPFLYYAWTVLPSVRIAMFAERERAALAQWTIAESARKSEVI
jgi:hypothetical protein